MTSRSIRRLTAGLTGALIAASALVATTTTAAQAATCATTVTLKATYKTNAYKGYNSLSASTTSTCGTPYYGTTTIQRWTGSAWVNSYTSSGASYSSLYGKYFNTTTAYRAVYSGGSSSSNTWSPSASATTTIGVYRAIKTADKSTRRASVGVFKINPASTIRGQKATFQVRKGGKWRGYKKVKVGKSGKIKVTFANSRKGIKYRMVLPAGKGMIKSVHGPITAKRY